MLAARRHRLGGLWSGVRAGAGAGAVSGVFVLVASGLALVALAQPALESAARILGADGRLTVGGAAFLALAIVAVLGLLATAIAGVATVPIAQRAA